MLLDAGTKPGHKAIYHCEHFERNLFKLTFSVGGFLREQLSVSVDYELTGRTTRTSVEHAGKFTL